MSRRRIVTITVLLACVALGWEIGGADRFGKPAFEAEETVRLRLHFAEVEREMLSRDISDLTPAQRTARAEQIRQLRRYSEEGSFPRNTYHPGARTPYFRDANGNLCAMAFLIAASGRGDIVDHIARNRNYEFVPDLVDEPGLADWLHEHGLTVEEAARIQPSYDGNPCCILDDPPAPSRPSSGYMVASAGASGLAGISIVLNARPSGRLSQGTFSGALGVGVGGLTMALGAFKIGDEGWRNQTVGAWNLVIGATAAVLGVRQLGKRNDVVTAKSSRLSLVPTAQAGNRPAIGFLGQLRF